MIDLKSLIQIAPYPLETKDQLLKKLDSLSDSQKKELENLSWELLIEAYENDVSFSSQIALNEVALGKKKASEVDLEKIEEDIFNDLTSKLNNDKNSEQINEIREKLQAQVKNPN